MNKKEIRAQCLYQEKYTDDTNDLHVYWKYTHTFFVRANYKWAGTYFHHVCTATTNEITV